MGVSLVEDVPRYFKNTTDYDLNLDEEYFGIIDSDDEAETTPNNNRIFLSPDIGFSDVDSDENSTIIGEYSSQFSDFSDENAEHIRDITEFLREEEQSVYIVSLLTGEYDEQLREVVLGDENAEEEDDDYSFPSSDESDDEDEEEEEEEEVPDGEDDRIIIVKPCASNDKIDSTLFDEESPPPAFFSSDEEEDNYVSREVETVKASATSCQNGQQLYEESEDFDAFSETEYISNGAEEEYDGDNENEDDVENDSVTARNNDEVIINDFEVVLHHRNFRIAKINVHDGGRSFAEERNVTKYENLRRDQCCDAVVRVRTTSCSVMLDAESNNGCFKTSIIGRNANYGKATDCSGDPNYGRYLSDYDSTVEEYDGCHGDSEEEECQEEDEAVEEMAIDHLTPKIHHLTGIIDHESLLSKFNCLFDIFGKNLQRNYRYVNEAALKRTVVQSNMSDLEIFNYLMSFMVPGGLLIKSVSSSSLSPSVADQPATEQFSRLSLSGDASFRRFTNTANVALQSSPFEFSRITNNGRQTTGICSSSSSSSNSSTFDDYIIQFVPRFENQSSRPEDEERINSSSSADEVHDVKQNDSRNDDFDKPKLSQMTVLDLRLPAKKEVGIVIAVHFTRIVNKKRKSFEEPVADGGGATVKYPRLTHRIADHSAIADHTYIQPVELYNLCANSDGGCATDQNNREK